MFKNQIRIVDVTLCLILGFMARVAYSDGYRNPPPTAEGIGKSGVNSVFVDDASAISYNPANLSFQTNVSLVASITMAQTDNFYQNPIAVSPFESDGDWNFLPNLYYSQPIGENGLAVGLGINTPYGQGISWIASNFAPYVGTGAGQTPLVPYDATIMLINVNPTAAFKINESLYLGAGIDIVYSQMELHSLLDSSVLGLPSGTTFDSDGDGDGWGFGANVGITWLPVERQRLALTYRSQVQVDYEGDFKLNGANTGDLEAGVQFPNIVTAGYGVQLSEKVQLEMLIEWLQWSLNDTLSMTAAGIAADQVNNWEDTFTFGVGGSWVAHDWLVLRGGYAFIPSPIPDETITPLLPDANRHALSFGLGFAVGGHILDLAYTYSIYSDRAAPITGASPGTYEIDSNLIGLTYSYSF